MSESTALSLFATLSLEHERLKADGKSMSIVKLTELAGVVWVLESYGY